MRIYQISRMKYDKWFSESFQIRKMIFILALFHLVATKISLCLLLIVLAFISTSTIARKHGEEYRRSYAHVLAGTSVAYLYTKLNAYNVLYARWLVEIWNAKRGSDNTSHQASLSDWRRASTNGHDSRVPTVQVWA